MESDLDAVQTNRITATMNHRDKPTKSTAETQNITLTLRKQRGRMGPIYKILQSPALLLLNYIPQHPSWIPPALTTPAIDHHLL